MSNSSKTDCRAVFALKTSVQIYVPAAVLGLVFSVWLLPASAQRRGPPAFAPSGDVEVVYRQSEEGLGLPDMVTRMLVQVSTRRIRREGETSVTLSDYEARREWSWTTDPASPEAGTVEERVITEDEVRSVLDPITENAKGTVRRQGEAVVAGVPCTVWRVAARIDDGFAFLLCITTDGLTLRNFAGRPGQMTRSEAVRVVQGPLDPVLFAPPQGWHLRRVDR